MCDAWQVENTDGYFAVFGHWVEEESRDSDMRTEWKVKSSLFGFVRMNCLHNRRRLGRALFKIAARLKVEHKVSSPHSSLRLELMCADQIHYL